MSGILIDANLLCLLVVGRKGAVAIRAHPRLDVFDMDSFVLLGDVLDRAGDPVLCPHVLAETANLLAYRQSQISVAIGARCWPRSSRRHER